MVLYSGKSVFVLLLCMCVCVPALYSRSFDFFATKTFADFVCVQYAAGMAAASQTIIVKAALSYQDIYEVWHYVKPPAVKCHLKLLKKLLLWS